MRYPVESFTPAERALLEPHFTNLDRPVFCLVNLPETVKGALFARYSRYPGSLRRLFVEEFAADAPAGARPFDGVEGERAAGLYERVFIGYGDDSIAQVGGAHLACEWVSNVLTKILQRGRLAAYLEQSTRYIPYDRPLEGAGGYRYYRDDELGPEYAEAMDDLFGIYSQSLERVTAWAAEHWPRDDEPEGAWRSSIRAKALDLLRGLLPASTLSHVGIYASGQAYEQMLLRLLPRRCPRRASLGELILERAEAGDPELRRPRRAARIAAASGSRYLRAPPRGDRALRSRGSGSIARERRRLALGRAGRTWTAPRRTCSAPRCSSRRRAGEAEIRAPDLDPRPDRARGADRRARRRARATAATGPGRGWEAIRYRFEIVSDYGGFRDLQRHRMLTCQWQRLGPDLGAGVPDEVRDAGAGDEYERALEISRARVRAPGRRRAAPRPPPTRSASATGSATCSTSTPARRCTSCELRSGREGHPTYRAVAQAMHERIGAVHPDVAAAMRHVDPRTEPRLERILSEIRTHRKRVAASEAAPPPGVSSLG